jgi:hypothetical protein
VLSYTVSRAIWITIEVAVAPCSANSMRRERIPAALLIRRPDRRVYMG